MQGLRSCPMRHLSSEATTRARTHCVNTPLCAHFHTKRPCHSLSNAFVSTKQGNHIGRIRVFASKNGASPSCGDRAKSVLNQFAATLEARQVRGPALNRGSKPVLRENDGLSERECWERMEQLRLFCHSSDISDLDISITTRWSFGSGWWHPKAWIWIFGMRVGPTGANLKGIIPLTPLAYELLSFWLATSVYVALSVLPSGDRRARYQQSGSKRPAQGAASCRPVVS